MLVVKKEYEKNIKKLKKTFITKEYLDVYHTNNWDRFTAEYDEGENKKHVSHIDFFNNAFQMTGLLKRFLENEPFSVCYVVPIYNDKYKIKLFEDDISKELYNEFKMLLNSLGLKVTTSRTLQMTKEEILMWIDRFSIGGFCGVLEYAILIPEMNIAVWPHHHMNYLVFAVEKEKIANKISELIILEKYRFCHIG